MTKITFRLKGGAGSGNYGHSGRPGKIGGSADGSPPPWPAHVKGNSVFVNDTWYNVEKFTGKRGGADNIRVTQYAGYSSDSSPLSYVGAASVQSVPKQPERHHYVYQSINMNDKTRWDYWSKYL